MADRKQITRWWLLVAGAALAIAMVIGLQFAARRQAVRHSQVTAAQAIATLPEREAAERVRELLPLDVDAVGTLAPLLADQREAVAAAARDAIADLLARWEPLPPEESSPRVACLAHELAAVAPHVPQSRRRELRDLAARVLVWPLAADVVNTPQLLADCEAILRLPLPGKDEVQVASRPAMAPVAPAVIAPEVVEVAPIPVATSPAVNSAPIVESPNSLEPSPFYGKPAEPERLIDASRERAEEPRQIRRPKAIKIDG